MRAAMAGILVGLVGWLVWTMLPDAEMSWQAQCTNQGGHVVSNGRDVLYCVNHGQWVSSFRFEE